MIKKSVLVLSASAGTGHVQAGRALVEAAKSCNLPLDIRHEDILDFTFPLFKKVYAELYFAVVNRSPELWGFLFKKTQSKTLSQDKSPLLKAFDHFNYKKYLKFLGDLRPDAVACTHFLPYVSIAEQLKQPSWKIPFYSVVTDFDAHSLWISPHIKRYYCASEEAAWTLQSHGIPEENICLSGIPIMPQFATRQSKRTARRSLNLEQGLFTVMMLSGGYGIGVIDLMVPSVAEFLGSLAPKKFQLIVVCGRNPDLFKKLNARHYPDNVTVKLYKFVDFINDLMDASDVLVTKSGGLTVSEALAKQLPMIIFDPFPGQEGWNADYVTEHGAGLKATAFSNLHFKLKSLIESPQRLKQLSASAKKLGFPHASKSVLKDLNTRLQRG